MAKTAKQKFLENELWLIIAGVVCLGLVAAILFIPAKKKEETVGDWGEYSAVTEICELATMRSYYHNVVVHEEKPEGATKVVADILTWPFNKLLKPGYKQFWLEYSGVVEAGIDLKKDKILVKNPDPEGVVVIYMPDAKVLSITADENSFSQPLDEEGLFTSITAKERSQAYAEAQENMRQEAQNDQSLLGKAKTNAKILLEQYIVNVGKEMGKTYTVSWAEEPW